MFESEETVHALGLPEFPIDLEHAGGGASLLSSLRSTAVSFLRDQMSETRAFRLERVAL